MNEQEVKTAEYFGKSLEKATQKALDEEREALDNTRDIMAESAKLEKILQDGYAPQPDPKIRPNGFYVLVEMIEVKNVSSGGIHLGDVRKEQDACDIGYIRAFGNTAFNGMPGCNPSEYPPAHEYFAKTPYQIWGLDIGDKVEYRRHEGKISGIPGCEKLRYIPDTQIIGKVL